MKREQILSNIAYWCTYIFIYALSLLPIKFLYYLSTFTFWLVFNIIGYRREIVIQNIARAFPEKRYDDVRSLSKMFYQCFTFYFAEIVKTVSLRQSEADDNILFENLEVLENYLCSGRNVIASLGHCGNWELLNLMSRKLDHDLYAVYKPLKSKTISRLMLRIRGRFGMNLIADKSVARHIRTKGVKSSVYLFIADQCPVTLDEKFRFSFLNQERYFFSGMEK